MKNKIVILLIAVSLLLVMGCSKKVDEKASSMEQLYKEQGVPVKIENITLKAFQKDLSFNANLTGINESTVNSMVSDQIASINVKIGSHVKKDQVILEFPMSNPSVSYRQAEAAFKLAKQSFDRLNNLYNNGGISKQDLDNSETQLKVSQANLDAVQQIVKVRAPIDGIVTDINAKVNQKVAPGDYLFTISQLSSLKGRVWLTENELAYVKKGNTLTFNWNGKAYDGHVTDIALSMNADKQAFGADIEVHNRNNELRSGINGQVSLNVIKLMNSIIIPRNIIQTDDQKKPFVYVVENEKAVMKYIETGLENNLDIQVLKGLNPGDLLVVEGFNLLDNGLKTKIVE